MSNRRFEMYEYRQVIYRMRQGESDRGIAKAGLIFITTIGLILQLANVPPVNLNFYWNLSLIPFGTI